MSTLYYSFGYVASGSAAKEVQVNATFDEIDAAIHGVAAADNPMTTGGDIIYEAASPPMATRLPIGTTGQVLTVAGGLPSWATPLGAVSSVFTRTGAIVATSGDYTVAQVTGAAPLASPTFTGTVVLPSGTTATTQTAGDNTTKISTTAFVTAAVAAGGGFTSPMTTGGDIIYESVSPPIATRLPIGTTGQVLTVAAGLPSWATPSGGGGGATVPYLASFTWVNQGSSTARQTVGSGPIEATVADSSSVNWRGLFVATPATPYKVTANLRGYQPAGSTSGANTATFGVYFYDGTKLEGFEMMLQASGGTKGRVEKMNSVTSDGSTPYTASGGSGVASNGILYLLPTSSWFQLRNNGTTMYFDYSVDGANFINVFSEAVGTWLTPTNIGFGGISVTSGTETSVIVNLLSWTVAANATL